MDVEEARKNRERAYRVYSMFQEDKDAQMYEMLREELVQFIDPQADVLEIACGSGQLTMPLADAAGSWTACDLSGRIVKKTKSRARSAHVHAVFEVQNPESLTYEDHSFDLVLAVNILHMLENPSKALGEVERVLRPEGLLIAPGFIYEGEINDFKLWLMELGGCRVFHKWTLETYTDFLEANGFLVVRITMLRDGLLPLCVVFCKKELML